jgi:4-amino-4-deoxy-L-arabinose transferase-like glycosyltransferase
LACIASRLATRITYIEDPDSLRFALSVADEYDIAALQPHFPGYPVFWAAAELFAGATGSFSVAFTLVGGLSTAGLIWALLRLWGRPLQSVEGTVLTGLVGFNPLLWLMGTRYMPDLMGTAGALATLAALFAALRAWSSTAAQTQTTAWAVAGMAGAGLLAGLRLSYMPLVILPVLVVLWRVDRRGLQILAGTVGVLVWLIPMIVDTGFWTLVDVAWGQTTGHFTEFGGTVQTAPDLSRRVLGMVQGLWADGLGGWWPGRHPITGAVGLGALSLGGWRLWRTAALRNRRVWLLAAAALLYAVWIFFFQNVIHKSRHVLPLLPLLLMILAAGGAALWRARWTGRRVLLIGLGGAYAAVTLVLVTQHMSPSAIAQTKSYVERQVQAQDSVHVASVPLINDYLRAQQVEAHYLSIEDSSDVRRLRAADTGTTLVVGTYASLLDREPTRTKTFYHNPHVNRMWPEVTVYVYEH